MQPDPQPAPLIDLTAPSAVQAAAELWRKSMGIRPSYAKPRYPDLVDLFALATDAVDGSASLLPLRMVVARKMTGHHAEHCIRTGGEQISKREKAKAKTAACRFEKGQMVPDQTVIGYWAYMCKVSSYWLQFGGYGRDPMAEPEWPAFLTDWQMVVVDAKEWAKRDDGFRRLMESRADDLADVLEADRVAGRWEKFNLLQSHQRGIDWPRATRAAAVIAVIQACRRAQSVAGTWNRLAYGRLN